MTIARFLCKVWLVLSKFGRAKIITMVCICPAQEQDCCTTSLCKLPVCICCNEAKQVVFIIGVRTEGALAEVPDRVGRGGHQTNKGATGTLCSCNFVDQGVVVGWFVNTSHSENLGGGGGGHAEGRKRTPSRSGFVGINRFVGSICWEHPPRPIEQTCSPLFCFRHFHL